MPHWQNSLEICPPEIMGNRPSVYRKVYPQSIFLQNLLRGMSGKATSDAWCWQSELQDLDPGKAAIYAVPKYWRNNLCWRIGHWRSHIHFQSWRLGTLYVLREHGAYEAMPVVEVGSVSNLHASGVSWAMSKHTRTRRENPFFCSLCSDLYSQSLTSSLLTIEKCIYY